MRKRTFIQASVKPIIMRRPKTHYDGLRTTITYEDIDVTSPTAKEALPTPEELSLRNQLKAGIDLREIPVGNILTPEDIAGVSTRLRTLANQKLNELSKNQDFLNSLKQETEVVATSETEEPFI